jgi:hypothetical protein
VMAFIVSGGVTGVPQSRTTPARGQPGQLPPS